MTVLSETQHSGGFLVWEVLRDFTRETVILAAGSGKLLPGTVLGKVTTGGKYTALAPGATNGSQNAAGVLWAAADASDADRAAVVIVRGPAILNRSELTLPDGITEAQLTSLTTALTALGIVLR
ncbi:head decoration protein [Paradonghicola geojensis]|nr:head decoration protein [Marivivens geojensis]